MHFRPLQFVGFLTAMSLTGACSGSRTDEKDVSAGVPDISTRAPGTNPEYAHLLIERYADPHFTPLSSSDAWGFKLTTSYLSLARLALMDGVIDEGERATMLADKGFSSGVEFPTYSQGFLDQFGADGTLAALRRMHALLAAAQDDKQDVAKRVKWLGELGTRYFMLHKALPESQSMLTGLANAIRPRLQKLAEKDHPPSLRKEAQFVLETLDDVKIATATAK